MLAVILVILLFVVLALGVILIGMRSGGRGGAARAALRSPARTKGFALVLAVVYLGIGVALPLVLLTGNHSNASAQVGGIQLTAGEKAGRALFGEHCGVCHTLAAANAIGKVGPNLDVLKPPAQLVLHTIVYGCLQNPSGTSDPATCLGYGVMPASVVQGKDAQQVADFVAKVAGKE